MFPLSRAPARGKWRSLAKRPTCGAHASRTLCHRYRWLPRADNLASHSRHVDRRPTGMWPRARMIGPAQLRAGLRVLRRHLRYAGGNPRKLLWVARRAVVMAREGTLSGVLERHVVEDGQYADYAAWCERFEPRADCRFLRAPRRAAAHAAHLDPAARVERAGGISRRGDRIGAGAVLRPVGTLRGRRRVDRPGRARACLPPPPRRSRASASRAGTRMAASRRPPTTRWRSRAANSARSSITTIASRRMRCCAWPRRSRPIPTPRSISPTRTSSTRTDIARTAVLQAGVGRRVDPHDELRAAFHGRAQRDAARPRRTCASASTARRTGTSCCAWPSRAGREAHPRMFRACSITGANCPARRPRPRSRSRRSSPRSAT